MGVEYSSCIDLVGRVVYDDMFHLYYKRVDPVGSRSRRLWESHPIPTERYERRPCFCRVRCTCRSSDFLLFVKNGFVVGARTLKPECNSGPLKQCCLLL